MMAKKRSRKRGNGEGSIFPLANGKWRAEITIGWTAEGTRLRRRKTAKSHADASAFLREMQAEADRAPIKSDKTLSAYLQNWLLGVDLSQEENTATSYRNALEKHVMPLIGKTKLTDVKPSTVRWLLSELSNVAGGRTVENAYVVLRTALASAVKDGEILVNPCASVSKPKHDPKEIFPFTHDEAKAILKATESHRLHGLFVVAFSTGLRSAELFGLEWSDFDGKEIHVQRQATSISGRVVVKPPKSKSGIRRIELTTGTIQALEDRRRLAMAEGHAGNKLIFPAPRGGYVQRGTFRTRVWNRLLDRLQLERRGFHHTRHSFACLSLADGVPLATVSQILGHAKQETTLRFYSRHLPGHQKTATESATRLFG